MIVKSPLCIRAQATEQVVEKKKKPYSIEMGVSIPFRFLSILGLKSTEVSLEFLTTKVQIF